MREIVGVDPALNQRWSTRRVMIKNRQGELAAEVCIVIMVGRQPRWKRCSWLSKPPWRRGTPNTNPAPWPSSVAPGMPKPPKHWADPMQSRP